MDYQGHTDGNMLLGYLLLVKRCMDYQGHTDGNMLLGLPSAGQEVHGLPGAILMETCYWVTFSWSRGAWTTRNLTDWKCSTVLPSVGSRGALDYKEPD